MRITFRKLSSLFNGFAAKRRITIDELIGTEYRHNFSSKEDLLCVCLNILGVARNTVRNTQHFVDVIGMTPASFMVMLAKRKILVSTTKGIIFITDVQLRICSAVIASTFVWLDSIDFIDHNGTINGADMVAFMNHVEKVKGTTYGN